MARSIGMKSWSELKKVTSDELCVALKSVGGRLQITVYGDELKTDVDTRDLGKTFLDGEAMQVSLVGNECFVTICIGGRCFLKKVPCG